MAKDVELKPVLKVRKQSYSLGADPEVFLMKNDKFVSADGKFPGTKKKPFKLDRGAVQVDGLALEFNIEPAKTVQTFVKNMQEVIKQVRELVRQEDKNLKLVFIPFAQFDEKYFNDISPEAKILGCDPDWRTDGNQNPRPAIMDKPFRTAAGHIHIGWDKGLNANDPLHFEDCRFLATQMYGRLEQLPDHHRSEAQRVRLQYYGMQGSFRPKSYGVELRSPSNEWVESKEDNIMMFNYVMTRMKELPSYY